MKLDYQEIEALSRMMVRIKKMWRDNKNGLSTSEKRDWYKVWKLLDGVLSEVKVTVQVGSDPIIIDNPPPI